MDPRVQEAAKETCQHFRLGIRISSFLEAVFLRKDKLFESVCDTLFRYLFGKEGDIALVEACAGVIRTDLDLLHWGYGNLLFISQVVNEVVFGDGLGRLERRALDVAITLVIISDDRGGST